MKQAAPDLHLFDGVVADRVLTAMRAASEMLARAGVRHALCGGLAIGAHGYARATKDVDFLVGRTGASDTQPLTNAGTISAWTVPEASVQSSRRQTLRGSDSSSRPRASLRPSRLAPERAARSQMPETNRAATSSMHQPTPAKSETVPMRATPDCLASPIRPSTLTATASSRATSWDAGPACRAGRQETRAKCACRAQPRGHSDSRATRFSRPSVRETQVFARGSRHTATAGAGYSAWTSATVRCVDGLRLSVAHCVIAHGLRFGRAAHAAQPHAIAFKEHLSATSRNTAAHSWSNEPSTTLCASDTASACLPSVESVVVGGHEAHRFLVQLHCSRFVAFAPLRHAAGGVYHSRTQPMTHRWLTVFVAWSALVAIVLAFAPRARAQHTRRPVHGVDARL